MRSANEGDATMKHINGHYKGQERRKDERMKGTRKRVPFFMMGVVVLLLGVWSTAYATEAFDVQEVGSSARMIGMGGVEGFGFGAENVFENSAGLSRIKHYGMSAFTTKFMDEAEYKNIAGAVRIGNGVLGIGYMTLGYKDIAETGQNSSSGEYYRISNFRYDNSVVKVGYARDVTICEKTVHIGTALDYYFTNMSTYTSNGVNLDCGMLIPVILGSEVSVNLKNILWFSDKRYNNGGNEHLPLEFVGSVRVPIMDIRVLGQVKAIENKPTILKNIGIEYIPGIIKLVNVEVGYKEGYDAVERVKGTLTAGMGLKVEGVTAQYAYEQCEYRENESKHYFSIGFQY